MYTQESYSLAIQSTSYLRNVNAPCSFFSGLGESEKLFTRPTLPTRPRGTDSFAFFFSPDSQPNLASERSGGEERGNERRHEDLWPELRRVSRIFSCLGSRESERERLFGLDLGRWE